MGTTQAALRAILRQDLRDEDSSAYLWTDAILNRHLQDAITEVCNAAPSRSYLTVAMPSSTYRVDISGSVPSTYLWTEAVEYPLDEQIQTLWAFREEAGPKLLLIDQSPPGAGVTLRIWYAGRYTVAEGSSDLPADLDRAVLDGARAYAMADQAVDMLAQLGPRDSAKGYAIAAGLARKRFDQRLAALRQRTGAAMWRPSWKLPDGG